jgi:hypothetical protein
MAALTDNRTAEFCGSYPSRGTFPIEANKRIWRKSVVCLNSAGRAIPESTIAVGAVRVLGVASAEYNNLTGSEAGGAASALQVEVEYGVFDFAIAAAGEAVTISDVGSIVFLVDNQTVGKTNAGATLLAAGILTEVRNGRAYVYMGVHVFPLTA